MWTMWRTNGRSARRLRMRRPVAVGSVFLLLLVSLIFAGAGCSGGTSLERVELDSGPITGNLTGDIWSFKGIPYAAPPVGELRWRPPQAVAAWHENRACDSFGPACPQPLQAKTFYLAVGETNEDCLYLNVWSPARSSGERLPVMVWIHGGSFETGAGSMAVYDGTRLAERGMVVVTINYRLGPLGFLAHPALSAESGLGVSGNYGLLDQIAALEWVQKNVAAFGGDPEAVTVFGESAGGISILDLMVSPLAEGLFQRAIVQSGIMLDQGFGVSTNGTLAQEQEQGLALAERLGIDDSDDAVAALRAKTPDELLAAVAEGGTVLEQGLRWKPVADGHVLPDVPTTLWAAGRSMKIPLIIGSTKDEGNLFTQGVMLQPHEFEAQMEVVFGPYVDEALALYPVESETEVSQAFSRMLTEVGFASTARFAARVTSEGASEGDRQGNSAFLYHFTRVPFDNPLGAFHGVEIPYVFGNTALFTVMGPIEQADQDLSDAIMGYWTRFAATGDPNGDGAVTWPRYETESDLHLELGDRVAAGGPGLYQSACDLADKVRGLR